MISEILQKQIESIASSYLLQGRKAWDLPHTKAVVRFAIEIAEQEKQDKLILFTASWFHDTGYAGLFDTKDSNNMQNILDRKKLHMEKGAEYVKEFLDRSDIREFYTTSQRARIVHLVSIHDKLKELKDLDEMILMEADTLGALNPEGVTRSLDEQSQKRYMQGVLKARWPKFRTELGKKYFREIMLQF
jgi:HD superfamily phosphodiesterase